MARRESKTVIARRERVAVALPILRGLYPDVRCSLDFSTPLELVVATVLSAQCTDARVNVVTRELFAKYRSAADYANATPEQLEHDVRSTNFFRTKARAIRAMAQALIEQHGGEVPRTMDELTALAGVGRKTANVVLGNAFNTSVGVTVDTHVGRLSHRLGWTRHEDDPVKVELDLMAIVPPDAWCEVSHLLIYHGRAICTARSPACERCALLNDCPTGPKILRARQGR